MPNLKPCPCGETPSDVCVIPSTSSKYAYVSGNCCGVWEVEFRTHYKDIESAECKGYAVQEWNEAARANITP